MLALLVGACGGGGDTGTWRHDQAQGPAALITASAEDAGVHCASGGIRIDAGLDADRDGALGAGEVGSTQYFCRASAASASGVGMNTLAQMRDEPAGIHCPSGGKSVHVGVDRNDDGLLGADEIASTGYVCNGIEGANRINTLVDIAAAADMSTCPLGGRRVRTGPDRNANDVLDPDEVSATGEVCNAEPWTFVADAAVVQADANWGYIAANDAAQVAVRLPAEPAIAPGDVVRVRGVGAAGWRIAQNDGQAIDTKDLGGIAGAAWQSHDPHALWLSVASSANGMRLLAGAYGYVYTSGDGGSSWTAHTDMVGAWYSVASSADGEMLLAVDVMGNIQFSRNGGASWNVRTHQPASSRGTVACSADGRNIVVVFQDGSIDRSSDGGDTWTQTTSAQYWRGVAASESGSRLVAVTGDGEIYISEDYGASWSLSESIGKDLHGAASSGDGSRLIVVARSRSGQQMYTSADHGATWSPRGPGSSWTSVSSSFDGMRLAASDGAGKIWTSADGGVGWTLLNTGFTTAAVALSSDGSKLVSGDSSTRSGPIYTSIASTTRGQTGSISGGQTDTIELQYLGNGMFSVLSHEGQLAIQ